MHLSRAAHDLRSGNSGTPPLQSEYSLQDLTEEIQKSAYAIAAGGFGDIWKCELVKPNGTVEVAQAHGNVLPIMLNLM